MSGRLSEAPPVVEPFAATPAPNWIPLGAAPPKITYGTTPPVGPVDGDEWVFPADATNGVMWRFRYNAASASAYKWEFVGGAPMFHSVPTQQSFPGPNGAVVNLATDGPLVVVARAGDYETLASAYFTKTKAELVFAVFDVTVGDVGANALGWHNAFAGTGEANTVTQVKRLTAVPAGSTLKMRYYGANASGLTPWWDVANRELRVTPVRVA